MDKLTGEVRQVLTDYDVCRRQSVVRVGVGGRVPGEVEVCTRKKINDRDM